MQHIFSICVFFYKHSQVTGQLGKGVLYLTPLNHFHSLHWRLDISRVIKHHKANKNSRSQSQSLLQTNQSDRNREISRLQAQFESSKRHDTRTYSLQVSKNEGYRLSHKMTLMTLFLVTRFLQT